MELVGQILKKNRESKKLLLSDVSKELMIPEETLNNIENGYLQNDIDIVFILGHVRAYCSFLNLAILVLNYLQLLQLNFLWHCPHLLLYL